MDQLPDSSLIELAKGGDQHAFAELYSRYFDPVYDFGARMTRNRDEAADIAQDTFLKAMNALGGLQKGASFKSWIFTIARNTALNRIEKNARTRPLTFEGADGEEVGFDVVDTDRFSDPEEAAQANAVSALVWQAAAGLDPKQLSLLDLHLRQGLDSGEIADVLGVTKNNGYVMLNRLKKAVEESIGAFIMFKDGRQHCGDLEFALSKVDIDGMSPEVRKVVERHVAQCANCAERKKKLAPLAAFAAFGAIGAPVGAKAHILEGLMQQWPGPAAGGGSSSGGSGSAGQGGGFGPNEGQLAGAGAGGVAGGGAAEVAFFERFRKPAILAIGGIAAVLMALLFVPQSPLALIRDDGGNTQAADIAADPGDEDPTATPPGTSAAGAPTSTPKPGETPLPTSAAQQGQPTSGPSATPTRTSTPVPTPGPGTPTFTPSPTATRTSTSTPTSTPTVTPTSTPTATATTCVPALNAQTFITLVPGGGAPLQINNGTACSTVASVSSQTSWLQVGGGGTVPPFSSINANIQVTGGLPTEPGTYSGTILIAWPGGSPITVTVQVTRQAPPNSPPVISGINGRCLSNNGTSTWGATVTDEGTVESVQVRYTNANGAGVVVPLSKGAGNNWAGVGPSARGGSNYRITATDDLGLPTTVQIDPPVSCTN